MTDLHADIKDVLLRRQEVERLTALGRSAIYARLNPKHPQHDPTFPRPISVGGPIHKPTAVRWVGKEVQEWVEAQIAKSRIQITGRGPA